MTSELGVSQQGGEGGPGAIMKQINGGALRTNRRALSDIGNTLEADEEAIFNAKRPNTRSFAAQLVADAQARDAAKYLKKLNLNDRAAPKTRFVRPNKKPAKVDTAVSMIIEFEKPMEKQKKTPRSLTTTLTARSQALLEKPISKIEDIDAGDVSNELAVVEYVEDIYKYYRDSECESEIWDYMAYQPEINNTMRGILVDWLIETDRRFGLSKPTLYLTINLVDRFLSSVTVSRRQLQLVGISAMHLASKYEEITAPDVHELLYLSDGDYTPQQAIIMERTILMSLRWKLTLPTPFVFLVRFIKACLSDRQMEHTVFFFGELGMLHYETVKYKPSLMAASAVYAARHTLEKTPAWNETLKKHTGFEEHELMMCAKLLVKYHSMILMGGTRMKEVYNKYSHSDEMKVALLPPAKTLLALNFP